MRVFLIRSEWDIGESGYAYASKGLAYKALEENPNIPDCLDEGQTLDDLIDEGLIGYTELELVQ